jgi:tRNA(Ile)-lysidine synthase
MGPPRLAVAASGGLDSTALLHCTVRLAAAAGVEVIALHVHHGLMPEADCWLRQVRDQSRRWGAGFRSRHLGGRPCPGESVEAWARTGRYRALTEMAHEAGCGLVLLAHHRRDQAETWLLQALRGAGAAGLSAMPRAASRDGILWVRPWLGQPREAIEAYVRRHRLGHVEDPSNGQPRYARSRLRLQVWPTLQQAFPDAETALANAASRAREAAALAAEAAALDLPALLQGRSLHVPSWLALPSARRRNALRAWLAAELPAGVPESLLARLVAELPAARIGHWPAPGGALRMYRGLLSMAGAAAPAPATAPAETASLDLSHAGEVELPHWRGHFIVSPVSRGGATPALLRAVLAGPRLGGERFRLAPGAAARSLKKQFQARGVPAWGRAGPLLRTAEGRLLFVPGLGIDAALQAPAGEPQLALHWLADTDAAAGRRAPAV